MYFQTKSIFKNVKKKSITIQTSADFKLEIWYVYHEGITQGVNQL